MQKAIYTISALEN